MTGAVERQLGAGWLQLRIDGALVPADRVGPVTIRHGRSSADAPAEPGTCSLLLDRSALAKLPSVGSRLVVELSDAALVELGAATAPTEPTPTEPTPAPEPTVTTEQLPLTDLAWTSATNGWGPVEIDQSNGESEAGDGPPLNPGAQGEHARGLGTHAPSTVVYDLAGAWHHFDVVVGVQAARGGAGSIRFHVVGDGVELATSGDLFGWENRAVALSVDVTGVNELRLVVSEVNNDIGSDHGDWGSPVLSRTVVTEPPPPDPEPDPDPPPPVLGDLAERARVRFVGDVTDAGLDVRPSVGQPLLRLVAVAPLARLGRVRVGDVPWPAELDGARAGKILEVAAAATGVVVDRVDPGTATLLPRDVDAQAPADLLDELSTATLGRLHAQRDGRLSWQDALHRRNAPTVAVLRADDVLSSTGWQLDLVGVVNDVTVVYGVLPPQVDDVQPQRPTTRLVDDVSVAKYGRLAARFDTQLAELDDAADLARQLVGRRSRPRWRINGLTAELLRTVDREQAVSLLTLQPGGLVGVAGLPAAAPITDASLFVEGWTETATRHAYALALDVVDYGLAGAETRWVDVSPGVSWAEVEDDVTWLSAVGWHNSPNTGRWLDWPDARRWLDVDPALTWQDAAPERTPA